MEEEIIEEGGGENERSWGLPARGHQSWEWSMVLVMVSYERERGKVREKGITKRERVAVRDIKRVREIKRDLGWIKGKSVS